MLIFWTWFIMFLSYGDINTLVLSQQNTALLKTQKHTVSMMTSVPRTRTHHGRFWQSSAKQNVSCFWLGANLDWPLYDCIPLQLLLKLAVRFCPFRAKEAIFFGMSWPAHEDDRFIATGSCMPCSVVWFLCHVQAECIWGASNHFATSVKVHLPSVQTCLMDFNQFQWPLDRFLKDFSPPGKKAGCSGDPPVNSWVVKKWQASCSTLQQSSLWDGEARNMAHGAWPGSLGWRDIANTFSQQSSQYSHSGMSTC